MSSCKPRGGCANVIMCLYSMVHMKSYTAIPTNLLNHLKSANVPIEQKLCPTSLCGVSLPDTYNMGLLSFSVLAFGTPNAI